MNAHIELLLNHRSIRKFQDKALTQEQADAIISAAQAASTSSNLQAYSIIVVTEPGLKKELARLSGQQSHVEHSGLFLVFCGDLSRVSEAISMHGKNYRPNTESFTVATVDAALAAQNAAIAAESLDLGICYIGGIRNHIKEVSDMLRLPRLVYPLFGMAIGVPDETPSLRPRMPKKAVVHLNAYQPDQSIEGMREYDEIMRAYYIERTQGKANVAWSTKVAEKYSEPTRPHLLSYLEMQGIRLN